MKKNILENAKIIVKPIKEEDKGKSNTRAIVMLDFGDFKLKWFRVQTDRDNNLWVNPPSISVKGKYKPAFFIEDKESWHRLQEKIINEYNYQIIPIINEEEEIR